MPAQPDTPVVDRILRSIPAAVAVLEGPAHVFRYHNREYRELVGAPDTLVGLTVAAALPEVVGQGFVELLDTVYRSGTPHVGTEVEVELARGADGATERIFVNFAYVPRRDAGGRVDGIIVHVVDVSAQVHSRERNVELVRELDVERQRLLQVIEQMRAGVALADASGKLLMANQSWRDSFEMDVDELTEVSGIDDYEVFVGYRMDGSRYKVEEFPISRALLHGEQCTDRIRFEFASGSERIVDVSARRLAAVAGDPVAAMVTTIDMTAQLELEEQVARQREQDLLRRAEAERRRGYEVNDTVVQRLAVADLAFDLGEVDVARTALRDALSITKRLISEWGARADDLSLSAERMERVDA